jgi:hypothetical protein
MRERRESEALPPYEGVNKSPVYCEALEVEIERPDEAHLSELHRYREA